MRINTYQDLLTFLEFDNKEKKPKLLIHACCAPCSSYVLELLKKRFEIDIYFYNPNIYPKEEYDKRYEQFKKLTDYNVLLNGTYDDQTFFDVTKEYSLLKEGSMRCYQCYDFRIKETAKKAAENGYDFFTTTLSISPYKNSDWINEIGIKYQKQFNVEFLYSNFKKSDGYKRSISLSKEYGLYRQHYCGCIYSKLELEQKNNKES